jgi:hypothetical protein
MLMHMRARPAPGDLNDLMELVECRVVRHQHPPPVRWPTFQQSNLQADVNRSNNNLKRPAEQAGTFQHL